MFASIKSTVKAVDPLDAACPVNWMVTVPIVRSSAAFAAQLRVAISSTATRVRPVVEPKTLEVSDGLVRYTTCAVPSGAPDTVAEALESLPNAVTEEVALMLTTWDEADFAPPETKVATSPTKLMVFEPFLGMTSDEVEPKLKTILPVVVPATLMLIGPASNVLPSYNRRLLNDAMPAVLEPIVSKKVISDTRTSSALLAASFIL